MRDHDRKQPDPSRKPADKKEEAVDEASDESFPASDPPSFSPLRSGSPDEVDPKRDADVR